MDQGPLPNCQIKKQNSERDKRSFKSGQSRQALRFMDGIENVTIVRLLTLVDPPHGVARHFPPLCSMLLHGWTIF